MAIQHEIQSFREDGKKKKRSESSNEGQTICLHLQALLCKIK